MAAAIAAATAATAASATASSSSSNSKAQQVQSLKKGPDATFIVRETNPYLMASYATIILLWVTSQFILIPYVLHLLVLVTAILYAACHGSLILLGSDENEDEIMKDGSTHSTTSVTSSQRETLKHEDALQFPIIGSISLFSLYLAFKFLDKDLVNLIIGGYFGIIGCLAMTITFAPIIAYYVISKSKNKQYNWEYKYNHSLPEWIFGPSPLELTHEMNTSEIISLLFSIVVSGFYVYYKPWYLNNVIGICFCLQGIERFSLGTYKIGAILLIGLFFYDIFWVFGTEVMVTVAKNLDGPIKILFPRDTLERNPITGKLELSLLGLGDIVIPGFFLALLLRFDAHNAMHGTKIMLQMKQQETPAKNNNSANGSSSNSSSTPSSYLILRPHDSFNKPYFHSALLAYVLGLGMTMFIMIQFKAAQPALLYLVPACLFSSLTCAYIRGEVKQLFAYSEEEEDDDEEDEATTDAAADSNETDKKDKEVKKDK